MPHFCGDFVHDLAFFAIYLGDWAVFSLFYLRGLALRARSTVFLPPFFYTSLPWADALIGHHEAAFRDFYRV